jgi:hypothetical protein
MNQVKRFLVILACAGSVTALAAGPKSASSALALVSADATAAGMVRFNRLKTSPAAARLFHEADGIGADGEAARFLHEAGLDPKKDIDSVTFSMKSDADTGRESVLVAFEGRFNPEALLAAAMSRGAVRIDAAPASYLRLPESADGSKNFGDHNSDGPGAVAFLNSHLILAGSEAALLSALDESSLGHMGLSENSTLGKALSRVNTGSAAWAIVDATKIRSVRPGSHAGRESDSPVRGVESALKSVTLMAFQADTSGTGISISATGLSSDREALDNLQDVLKGVLAAWRMAAQEKNPETVSMIRKFSVSKGDDSVTISGTLPASFFDEMRDHAHREAGRK